jgi:hypothetical protein
VLEKLFTIARCGEVLTESGVGGFQVEGVPPRAHVWPAQAVVRVELVSNRQRGPLAGTKRNVVKGLQLVGGPL